MEFLTSLPWLTLLIIAIVGVGGITLLSLMILRRLLGRDAATAQRSAGHAGPLMPTLGALFAFLSAFMIATEWSMQSQANGVVTEISASSSQLAWAATAPGVDRVAIQSALSDELADISGNGWAALANGSADLVTETNNFQHLQRVVREQAEEPGVSQSNATELLASMDSLASARRALGGAATQLPPLLLFAALLASGLALCINAVTLTIGAERRATTVVITGVIVVAIDLALVCIMAAPFRGTVRSSPRSIDRVAAEIDDGYFTR